jgi:thiol-disulfide isomerase/thioredoxin
VTRGQSLALAAVIICLGAAAGFVASHVGFMRTSHPTVNRATTLPAIATPGESPVNGDSSDEGRTGSPRTIPASIPDISLVGTDGAKHALSDWKGRPLLINFWATWCAPCRREIPLLKRLRRENSAQRVEVIGIAVDFRDAVQRYALDMGIDYPILVGEQDGLEAIAAFGMDTVFPFTVFVDSKGQIVTLKVGELHPDEASFILDRMQKLDQGSIQMADARKQIASGIALLAAHRDTTDDGKSLNLHLDR